MVAVPAARLEVGGQGHRPTGLSERDRNPPRLSTLEGQNVVQDGHFLTRIRFNLLGMILGLGLGWSSIVSCSSHPIVTTLVVSGPPVPDRPTLHDQQAQL